MLSELFYLLAAVAALFWLIQLVDLLGRDANQFDSHTHKLAWFLTLVSGSLVGAIWYYIWKRDTLAAGAGQSGGE